MKDLNDVLTNALNASHCKPVSVTEEQYKALEALVVGYMTVAHMSRGLTADVEKGALAGLDLLFDKILVVTDEK